MLSRCVAPYPTYKPSDVPWLRHVPTHSALVQPESLGRLSKGTG